MLFRLPFLIRLLAALWLVAAGIDAARGAMPRVAGGAPDAGLLRRVAATCVRLSEFGGNKTLINSCNECRIVRMSRKRPSDKVPVLRTFTMPPRAKIDLTIKGPGRNRITGDDPCRGEAPEPEIKGDDQKCVQVRRAGPGKYVVINTCAACRALIVERIDHQGQSKRTTMTLARLTNAPLNAEGAAQARIIAESSCR